MNEMGSTVIVTMFFNLKELVDYTSATRPIEFYIQHGKTVLNLDYPMVIFCDNTTAPFLREARKNSKTIFIEKNIDDYDFYKQNWDIITENRKKSNGYKEPDNRNTVSYFLMGMFKTIALKIAKQRIKGTHYAWVDLGCAHILRSFNEKMIQFPNPKVSCCYIHYRGKEELANMKQYMEYGGPCGIASTAFTVESSYINVFYSAMMKIFHEMLYIGYGHTDETVMTYCYDQFPEIFEIYYGDYYSIMTNYHEPIEDKESIIHFFINQAKHKNRPDLAKTAEDKLNNLKNDYK